jgi:hypothetical protein
MDAIIRMRNLANQKEEKKVLRTPIHFFDKSDRPGKNRTNGSHNLMWKETGKYREEQPFIVKRPIAASCFGLYQSIIRLYVIIYDMKLRPQFR